MSGNCILQALMTDFLLRDMDTPREFSRFLNLRGPKGGDFFASTIFSQYYKFLFVSCHPFRLVDPLTRELG